MKIQMNKHFWGYVGRYSLVHVVVYLIMGLIFMTLQNYTEAFSTMESFANFRSMDSPIVQMAPLFQIFRGAFFAFILAPFYEVFMETKYGWVKLFFLLWGLTFIGSIAATTGSIEGLIYTKTPLKEHLVGLPEVTFQMLAFSWVFVTWEKRARYKEAAA